MWTEATHAIAYTVFSERDQALAMARSSVERQLAASAQIQEVTSVRPADGRVEQVQRFVVAMVTAGPMVQALKAHVLTNHPDVVPVFFVTPIVAAHDKYLGWVDDYVDEGRSSDALGVGNVVPGRR